LPGVKPANELAAQVVDSDIWEFCLRAWMQALGKIKGLVREDDGKGSQPVESMV